MFRKILGKLAACTLVLFGAVGTANAVPTTWEDLDINLFGYIAPDRPYSYTHDITGGAGGFRPGVDSISSATLSIVLSDDIDLFGGGEKVNFFFDGTLWSSSSSLFLNIFDFDVASLLTDGLLNVSITSGRGDFWYFTSLLTVTGDRSATVPEPAALSMFGFAILMMGMALRRRRAK